MKVVRYIVDDVREEDFGGKGGKVFDENDGFMGERDDEIGVREDDVWEDDIIEVWSQLVVVIFGW